MKTSNFISPFLRWAGSKRQIRPVLSSYWQGDYKRYLEPFLGSGSLYFYINPPKAILGDINEDLIDTYKQIRDDLDSVYSILSNTNVGKDEYYLIRSLDTISMSPQERAARFIYLNRFSFNGLYRTNLKGTYNVPFGGKKVGQIPDRKVFEACSSSLQSAKLLSGDFEIVLKEAEPGDFVYLDPPYRVEARRVFHEYDKSCFNINDLYRLKKWLDIFTKKGITFLLSYAKCEEAEIFIDDYEAVEIIVKRNIAGFSTYRKTAGEWLITNNDAVRKENHVK